MTIVRDKSHSDNFVILHKKVLKDPNLSLKAKGLWSFLMALPDSWDINTEELQTHFTDGKTSIRGSLNELLEAGYARKLETRERQGKDGKFERGCWIIYESKHPFTVSENQTPVNRARQSAARQVASQVSIDTVSKEEVSKERKNTSRNSVSLSEHAFRLADFFFEKILENDPKAKKPNFKKWAQDLDRMNRIDKRSWEEIKAIITFAQEDKFWKSNVLCPGKLREKATQLTMKMNPESIKHISSPLDILVDTNKKITEEIIEKYNLSEKQMSVVITGIWVRVEGKLVGLRFNENGYKDQIINLLRKGNHI